MKKQITFKLILAFMLFFGILTFVNAEESLNGENEESEDKTTIVVENKGPDIAASSENDSSSLDELNEIGDNSDNKQEIINENTTQPESLDESGNTETLSNNGENNLNSNENNNSNSNENNELLDSSNNLDVNNKNAEILQNDNFQQNEDVSQTNLNRDVVDTVENSDTESETLAEETNESVENYNIIFNSSENNYMIGDKGSISLSTLLSKLNSGVDISNVTGVTSSNSNITINQSGNDYVITNIGEFETAIISVSVGNDIYNINVRRTTEGAPDHEKKLIDNNDGTYTLELTVKGETETTVKKANVIIVMDTSGSMTGNYIPYTYSADTYISDRNVRRYYSEASSNPNSRNEVRYDTTYNRWYVRNSNKVYTGNVYESVTRLSAEASALDDLVDELLRNNDPNDETKKDVIEISVLKYNLGEVTEPESDGTPNKISKSYNAEDIKEVINNGSNSSGTNWEDGLRGAKSEAEALRRAEPNQPVYVIFLTDGEPTASHGDTGWSNSEEDYWRHWSNASDEARYLATTNEHTLYTIFTYGTNRKFINFLNNLTHYAYGIREYDNNDDDTDGKYNFGGNDTSIGDENGKNDHFFDASDTSELINAFNRIQDEINTAGYGNVGIVDGTTDKIVVSDGSLHLLDVDTTTFKYYKTNKEGTFVTWNEAPAATLNTDGEVIWNLGNGLLENGVTYKVTFEVWPSQYTLDLIADLKNNPEKYDTLDDNIKKYLIRTGSGSTAAYTLLTNTNATLSFVDTRPDGTSGSTNYINPDPVQTTAVKVFEVEKTWNGGAEDKVDLYVTRDEDSTWYQVPVTTNENVSKGEASIAVGIITEHNGVISVKTSGHDYTFSELGENSYHWEINAPVVRPMLINGVTKILKKTNVNEIEDSGYIIYVINKVVDEETITYYKAVKGNESYTAEEGETIVSTSYYNVDDSGEFALKGTNERRANLDIVKTVTGKDVGDSFKFDITVTSAPSTNPIDKNIWFSVADTLSGSWNPIEIEVEGATLEVKDGNPTYYYYAPSGSTFSVWLKNGYSLRVRNVLTGSTFTVTESNIENYELDILKSTNDSEDQNFENATINNRTVTGSINSTSVDYKVKYINDYQLTNVKVTKVWNDNNNFDNIRPISVTVKLLADGNVIGEKTQTLNGREEEPWSYTWADLTRYVGVGENRHEIVYTVLEEKTNVITGVDGEGTYISSITGDATNGFVITNTHTPKTSVTVTKSWNDNNNQDGKREDVVATVELYANGEKVGDSIEVGYTDNWSYTWSSLPVYEAGEIIAYTVNETLTTPNGYTLDVVTGDAESGYVVTNSYTPETTSVTVTKSWNDNNNQDGKREDVVATVELYANGEKVGDSIEVGYTDNWSYTWSSLPVYEAGEAILYTVKEILPEDSEYTNDKNEITITAIEEESSGTIELVNTYIPEVRNISVEKVWEDKENTYNVRPNNIVITLYADGEEINSAILDKSNDWSTIFENLPVYKDGEKITYTISENEIKNYQTEINGDMDSGFVVVNTVYGVEGNNPKTFDSITIYIIMLLVSLSGLIKFTYTYIKHF